MCTQQTPQALDSSAPNAVNGQLVKLSAHLKVSSVYTSLAQSAVRSYPQKILMSSENASGAAQQLFRMPLPENEYEAKQEVGYRTDMAFAALRFLNDRYSHVVEQRNDVVKLKDWANILKREGRVEDGAIAIARASDASVESAAVYMELDRIADLVRDRVAKLEEAEAHALLQAGAEPSQGHADAAAHPEAATPAEAGASAAATPAKVEQVKASEPQHNRYSLQEVADAQVDEGRQRSTASVLPGGHPDNRYSLLHAAALVADEAHGFSPAGRGAADTDDMSSMELPEHGSALARAYAAKAAAEETGVDAAAAAAAAALPPAQVPVALRALNEVLFEDLGYVGNRQDYYNPGNSMIHTVLQTRMGNPITLSVVYLAVARRVGLSLTGAECPSHFIVRGHDKDGETFFVDVFNKGKVMSLASCKQMFLTARSALLEQKDLAPVTPVQIYSRIMRNLVNSNMILGNGDKALLWTERLRVLEQVCERANERTREREKESERERERRREREKERKRERESVCVCLDMRVGKRTCVWCLCVCVCVCVCVCMLGRGILLKNDLIFKTRCT